MGAGLGKVIHLLFRGVPDQGVGRPHLVRLPGTCIVHARLTVILLLWPSIA